MYLIYFLATVYDFCILFSLLCLLQMLNTALMYIVIIFQIGGSNAVECVYSNFNPSLTPLETQDIQ